VAMATALHSWRPESVDELFAKVDAKQRKGTREAWISTEHVVAIMERTYDKKKGCKVSFGLAVHLRMDWGVELSDNRLGACIS